MLMHEDEVGLLTDAEVRDACLARGLLTRIPANVLSPNEGKGKGKRKGKKGGAGGDADGSEVELISSQAVPQGKYPSRLAAVASACVASMQGVESPEESEEGTDGEGEDGGASAGASAVGAVGLAQRYPEVVASAEERRARLNEWLNIHRVLRDAR